MRMEEKVPYLKMLMVVAMADDKVEESELTYFYNIAKLFELSQEQLDEIKETIMQKNVSIEELANGLKERTTKLSLIYDLLALCHVDNNYSLVEKNGLRDICKILGLEIEKLEQMENVMEESIRLQNRINTILER